MLLITGSTHEADEVVQEAFFRSGNGGIAWAP
jgi:DNA-directed RNA polymerase specialized sigma24 family protein